MAMSAHPCTDHSALLCGKLFLKYRYIGRNNINQIVDIPENVHITLKGHTVIVKGLRGVAINHISVEFSLLGKKKRLRDLQSCTEHGQGGYTGLPTLQDESVYARFPINAVIQENGSLVKI
ncbi:hypothetical protein GH733_001704 [Mirounga leonina]|nr:hypothetical protein GH733_001704 [Mirounga leonina]